MSAGEWESDGHEARRDYEREEIQAMKGNRLGFDLSDAGGSCLKEQIANPMTPCELANRLKEIVTQETGISVCWQQNSGPITSAQLARIRKRIEDLLDRFEFGVWIQEKVHGEYQTK